MKPRKAVFYEKYDEIVSMYKADKDMKEIAASVGVTPITLVSWLKYAGVFDPGRRRLDSVRTNEIVRLYSEELQSSGQIAASFGISASTVARILRARGITRSNSESQAIRVARETVGFSRFGKKGAFHSKKSGSWMPCDSAYEYARMLQLEHDDGVSSWRRCDDRILYVDAGIKRIYVPDLVVELAGGAVRVEEIKPMKLLSIGSNHLKFDAARDFYCKRGISFSVVTEADIGWDAIRRLDGVPLGEVPDAVRKEKRRQAALKHLRSMTPEQKAEYNRKAREREAAKRASDRDAYNRKARERRAQKKAQAEQGGLF